MGGKFRRFAGKTACVLAHAGIHTDDGEIRIQEGKALIDAAVGEVWDGTYAGAETVASLLRGAAALGGSPRGRRSDGRGSA